MYFELIVIITFKFLLVIAIQFFEFCLLYLLCSFWEFIEFIFPCFKYYALPDCVRTETTF